MVFLNREQQRALYLAAEAGKTYETEFTLNKFGRWTVTLSPAEAPTERNWLEREDGAV